MQPLPGPIGAQPFAAAAPAGGAAAAPLVSPPQQVPSPAGAPAQARVAAAPRPAGPAAAGAEAPRAGVRRKGLSRCQRLPRAPAPPRRPRSRRRCSLHRRARSRRSCSCCCWQAPGAPAARWWPAEQRPPVWPAPWRWRSWPPRWWQRLGRQCWRCLRRHAPRRRGPRAVWQLGGGRSGNACSGGRSCWAASTLPKHRHLPAPNLHCSHAAKLRSPQADTCSKCSSFWQAACCHLWPLAAPCLPRRAAYGARPPPVQSAPARPKAATAPRGCGPRCRPPRSSCTRPPARCRAGGRSALGKLARVKRAWLVDVLRVRLKCALCRAPRQLRVSGACWAHGRCCSTPAGAGQGGALWTPRGAIRPAGRPRTAGRPRHARGALTWRGSA